jgi:hypothetical protein
VCPYEALRSPLAFGEEEPDAWQAHEVVVNRLELVRQWVNPGYREGKVWVVLVSESETCGFDAKAEARRVPVEWLALGRRLEGVELVEAQDALVDLSRLLARAYDFDHVTERRDDEHLDRLRKHRPADDNAWLLKIFVAEQVPRSVSKKRCALAMLAESPAIYPPRGGPHNFSVQLRISSASL